MNHISQKASLKLNKFFGNSAPEPIANNFWSPPDNEYAPTLMWYSKEGRRFNKEYIPAYRLEDICSKRFCEAYAIKFHKQKAIAKILVRIFAEAYYRGGMLAIEKMIINDLEAK